MTSKETIEVLIEGGKAAAGQALGGTLGPLGINIADVLQKINKKTVSFKGMKGDIQSDVPFDSKDESKYNPFTKKYFSKGDSPKVSLKTVSGSITFKK